MGFGLIWLKGIGTKKNQTIESAVDKLCGKEIKGKNLSLRSRLAIIAIHLFLLSSVILSLGLSKQNKSTLPNDLELESNHQISLKQL